MDPVRLLVAARAAVTTYRRQPPASPADLAKRLDPTFVITPTITLLSDLAVRDSHRPPISHQRSAISQPSASDSGVRCLFFQPSAPVSAPSEGSGPIAVT